MVLSQHSNNQSEALEKRLLIVDDDNDLALSMADVLEVRGFRVRLAHNSKSFYKTLEDFRPDVILLDIRLGMENGLSLLEAINTELPSTLCVMMTGFASADSAIEALQLGAYDYLRKPVAPQDLFAVLKRCFDTIRLQKEKESAERSLRRNEMFLRKWFNADVVGLVYWNLDGRIIDANQHFLNMLEYTVNDLRESQIHWEQINANGQALHEDEAIRHIQEGRHYHTEELEFRSKSGRIIPVEVTSALFEGLRDSGFSYIKDISERKRRESEIQQLNRTLERRVEERTRQLLQLNQEKDEILGIASHDLRNPLSGMILCMGLAHKMLGRMPNSPEVEEIGQMIQKMESNALFMNGIIDDLLNVNHSQTGGLLKIERTLIDPVEVIRHSVEDYTPNARRKNINLHFTAPEISQPMLTDSRVLREISANLISNAVKFSPSGSAVYITMELDEHNFALEVLDEGPGISTDDQKKLFRRYTRLSATPTGGEPSTGLGLSIVKKYVDLLGGTIECKSTLHQGTAFRVQLPIADAKQLNKQT